MTDTRAREVRTFPDLEALSEAAAREIVAIANESVAARGRFTIALAGGNTPKRTYELLAGRYRDAIDWTRTEVVFGDERFVPPDDQRSNYRMAREALLAGVPISAEHIHAIQTNVSSVNEAADLYEETLRRVLSPGASGTVTPNESGVTVDLVLLGVGPDGHTASLFPGSSALDERVRWTRVVDAPITVQPAVPRVTVTFPFLNNARAVMFLVAGADKRPVVDQILNGAESARRYPAAMIAPTGRLVWLIEHAAVSALGA